MAMVAEEADDILLLVANHCCYRYKPECMPEAEDFLVPAAEEAGDNNLALIVPQPSFYRRKTDWVHDTEDFVVSAAEQAED